MNQPTVSVIMPSYNTNSEYIHKAIQSILNQTYTDFELIIIDDGSEPPVCEIISDLKDSRIRIIENKGNCGLPYTLNIGLESASGKYIIRMDADDICTNERLQKEIEFLESYPEIDVVSSYAKSFGAKKIRYSSFTEDRQIKAELLWHNPIIHPTVALRAETIKKYQIKYQKGMISEDYDIWSRMAFENHCRFAVIPEELLYYRIHNGQLTNTKKKKLYQSANIVLSKNLKLFNIKFDTDEIYAYSLLRECEKLSSQQIKQAIHLMKRILKTEKQEVDDHTLKMIYKKSLLKYGIKKLSIYAILQAEKL